VLVEMVAHLLEIAVAADIAVLCPATAGDMLLKADATTGALRHPNEPANGLVGEIEELPCRI
jgi:hypothetical protein